MKHRPSKVEQHEITLFRDEVGDIEHITHDKIQPMTPQIKPEPKFRQHRIEQHLNNHFSDEYEPHAISGDDSLSFRRSGIQHRLFSRLRTGHLAIEAELDLHGMTTQRAHHALAQFLQNCQQYQIRCIRIIHGKGWSSKHQKPILKTKINTWLQQEEDVLAFCSAPIEDGGTGAVYVLLRRQRTN